MILDVSINLWCTSYFGR